jgi:hypothetical protein
MTTKTLEFDPNPLQLEGAFCELIKFNLYPNVTNKNSTTITLKEYINLVQNSKELQQQQAKIIQAKNRVKTAQSDKDKQELEREYKELKRQTYCIAPTGYNKNDTGDKEDLITHVNRLICLDIDRKDNLHLTEKEYANAILNLSLSPILKDSFVVFSRSLTGEGFYFFLYVSFIKDKEHYKDSIIYLIQYIKQAYNLDCDTNATKLNQIRYLAPLSKGIINCNPKPFDNYNVPKFEPATKKPTPKEPHSTPQKKQFYRLTDYDKMNLLIKELNSLKIDITTSYNDWIAIATALYFDFGADGEYYFLEISKHFSDFCPKETAYKYRNLKPQKGVIKNLGFIFIKAKDYGIKLTWIK